MALTGKNISLPIYYDVDGVRTPFHNLVLNKFTVDSVVMSLGDKITGDVYYINSELECSMQEYVVFNGIEYTLVNPPTLAREGLVSDNSDLKGMSKYSFEFYHPMYILGNLPFTDVAVSYDEMRYKSQDKTFSWIGRPADLVAKLNKNLDGTEWVVVLSDRFPQDKLNELSDVLSFDKSTIADVLKVGYDTWEVPYVVDKLNSGEYYHTDAQNHNVDYYTEGKRFVVVFGLPSNDILDSNNEPFVFQFGQGVGLKNNSRTPRNNKIVTRISGYGSENNIPYGYPQIRWYGDPDATCTIGDSVGAKQNVRINGVVYEWAMSYPIYDGIVGGEYVKLIKHPFTRKHLMPSIYAEGVFNKTSQYLPNGSANPNYNPDIEIKDYYDAVENNEGYDYVNLINLSAPSYEIHEFDGIKPELGEAYILGATPINADLTDADGWDDTMDDNGNYLQSYFKITLPQLTFDIYACAAITEEMEINMRSGACIGCTFTVQVDWDDYKRNFYDSDMNFAPNGEQRDYTKYPDSSQGSITVIVQKDNNTFGTLMPNIYQYPLAGDAFVVLGISLPLSYITSAQERLDAAMKSYMLENNVYYFDYPLKFDEYFLAQHNNILNQIRPNTVIKFGFNDDVLELFVKQLTIKFNESPLPQYDITLTDNIEVVLNQIGQVVEDVDHLATLISLLRQNYNKNAWAELAKKLSKVNDDTASGLITFAKGWETLGFFSNLVMGSGAKVDAEGRGEFEEVNVRGALRASEFVFNLIDAEEGEALRSIGHGEIETVTILSATTGTATLKLEGDEWASLDVGDICRGMYSTIGKNYDNENIEPTDDNGFQNKKGYFSSYFMVTQVTSEKGSCTFSYALQNNAGTPTTEHPCPLMKFAVYGNTNDTKKERQSCMYISAVGIAPRILFLAGMNTWRIQPHNIKIAEGNIEGIKVWERIEASDYVSGDPNYTTTTVEVDGEMETRYFHLKPLHGDAGFYCEDNIYLGGIIDQFKAEALDAISSSVSNLGQAWVWTDSDSFVIDCYANGKPMGNTIVGITTKLYYGNNLCTLTSAEYSGFGQSYIATPFENNTMAHHSYNITTSQVFQSQTVSIKLTGTYNNDEFTAMKTVSIIANRQGDAGGQGEGAAWLDYIPSAIPVECDEGGKVDVQQDFTISARLLIGSVPQTITSKSAEYDTNEGRYTPTITSIESQNGYERWRVVFPTLLTQLVSSFINISMTGGGYTITRSIPIIPTKQGETGVGKAGYSAQLTKASDNIVVDSVGNIVGGITNRLYTFVNIWDAQNDTSLDYQSSGTLADGTYSLSVIATNCSHSIGDDGKINITHIANTSLDGCSIAITAQTYDGVVFNFVFPVAFTHLDQSYITFDLTNEYDSISYKTQTGNYDGLTVETWIAAYLNNERGNVRIGYNEETDSPTIENGYISNVHVDTDLVSDGYIEVSPQITQSPSGDVIGIDSRQVNKQILDNQGNASGLRLRINSNGRVWITKGASAIDMIDAKHQFDVSCSVVVGGVTYNSPKKRFTLAETTDSTIYRLILSATSVNKEESTYTPNTIAVKVSVTDDNGIKIYSVGANDTLVDIDNNELPNSDIKIRYINGVYNTSGQNTLLSSQPQFSSLTNKVMTIVLVDLTDTNNPDYLDIQTVTINEGGKDGAGQSWINASHDQFIVDCDETGKPLTSRSVTIDASLRWGDTDCYIEGRDVTSGQTTTNVPAVDPFSYSTPSGNTPSTSGLAWYNASSQHYRVKKTFTFSSSKIYNSGLVTITIVGTTNENGVTEPHTASKTVSIIMNRRGGNGQDGQDGRGIVSQDTYYKRSTDYSGVTPPSTSVDDPTLEGWVNTRIMPTEEEPYLWRFTRTIYSKEPLVEQTDAEMIYVWQDLVNPNLLADTDFKSNATLSSWYSHGLESSAASEVEEEASFGVSTKYTSSQGYNQFYGLFKAEENGGQNSGHGVIVFLAQYLYKEEDGLSKIEPNKWYTLSFYIYGKKGNDGQQDTGAFLFECNLVNIADTQNNNIYHGIEGGQVLTSTSPYINARLGENQGFVRYVITFKTKQTFSGNIDVRWYMYVREYTQEIWLCKPKLEVGKVATDYKPMRTITEPIARTSTWEEGKQYYQGAMGEPYFDIVSRNNKWFKCLRTHVSNATNAPQDGQSTDFWEAANNLSFVATDLLLADEAVIRLMFSQKILMTNASNQLIASINEDGNGSYYIYYPQTGRKRMGYCYDGYIRYWNNDAGNTQRWRLGQGGEIEMEDRWDSIWLCSFGDNYEDDHNFNANTRYQLVEYHQFISKAGGANIEHNMEIHASEDLTSQSLIPDGYYTPNERPTKTSGTLYQVNVYEIANGIIVDTGILYNNGNYQVND